MCSWLFCIEKMSSLHCFMSSWFMNQSFKYPGILHEPVFFSVHSLSVQALIITRMRMTRVLSLVTSQEQSRYYLCPTFR